MLIDHLGFDVADFNRSKSFYDAALAALDVAVLFQVPVEHTGGARASAGPGIFRTGRLDLR